MMAATEQSQTSKQRTTNGTSEQHAETDERHSVFSSGQKKFIVLMASIASFFSPLSANIYFPALNTLAHDLQVSNSRINLTVTTYLVCFRLLRRSFALSRLLMWFRFFKAWRRPSPGVFQITQGEGRRILHVLPFTLLRTLDWPYRKIGRAHV